MWRKKRAVEEGAAEHHKTGAFRSRTHWKRADCVVSRHQRAGLCVLRDYAYMHRRHDEKLLRLNSAGSAQSRLQLPSPEFRMRLSERTRGRIDRAIASSKFWLLTSSFATRVMGQIGSNSTYLVRITGNHYKFTGPVWPYIRSWQSGNASRA